MFLVLVEKSVWLWPKANCGFWSKKKCRFESKQLYWFWSKMFWFCPKGKRLVSWRLVFWNKCSSNFLQNKLHKGRRGSSSSFEQLPATIFCKKLLEQFFQRNSLQNPSLFPFEHLKFYDRNCRNVKSQNFQLLKEKFKK